MGKQLELFPEEELPQWVNDHVPFVSELFVNKYPDYKIINLDKLTYAGNLENLRDIENMDNYIFEKGDIVDQGYVNDLFAKYNFDGVIHLAAESHVDRSITNPMEFIMTNVKKMLPTQ